MILNKWMKCINNGNVKDIVSLYTNNSSLVSTFDGIFYKELDKIENYFQVLINKNTKVSIITENRVKLDENFLEFGIYEFTQGDKKIQARFTMISNDGTIIHHHSSLCN